MAGETFGPYRLEALLGRGGMGEVHRAFDTTKKRTVALKRLHPHLADDREFKARFRREAEVAARLTEPHIIPIHDYGEIEGQLFIDMRLVQGLDLRGLLQRTGPLSATRAVGILTQIASALAAAHTEGLIHRDVKPPNVLIAGADQAPDAGQEVEDYAYLVDFGIAHSAAATSMTATGTTVGTLAYMAPERFLGRHVDHRVDIYALGCLLYETLTGQRAFPGEGAAELMYSHLTLPPPVPSQLRPDLPSSLDRVVAWAMAKNPDERYPTATEFASSARQAITNSRQLMVDTAPPPEPAPPPPARPTLITPSAGDVPTETGPPLSRRVEQADTRTAPTRAVTATVPADIAATAVDDGLPLNPEAPAGGRYASSSRAVAASRLAGLAGLSAIVAAALLLIGFAIEAAYPTPADPLRWWYWPLGSIAALGAASGILCLIPRTRSLVGPGTLIGVAVWSVMGARGIVSGTGFLAGFPLHAWGLVVMWVAAVLGVLAVAWDPASHFTRPHRSPLAYLQLALGGIGAYSMGYVAYVLFLDLRSESCRALAAVQCAALEDWDWAFAAAAFAILSLLVHALAITVGPRRLQVSIVTGWFAMGSVAAVTTYLFLTGSSRDSHIRSHGADRSPLAFVTTVSLELVLVVAVAWWQRRNSRSQLGE